MRFLALLVLLAAALPAQVVRLANHAPTPWHGWRPTTTDYLLNDGAAGEWPDGSQYVAGRPLGDGLRQLHVLAKLAPGQRLELDLRDAKPADIPTQWPVTSDWTGGGFRANGEPLEWVGITKDGPSYLAHLRGRIGRMMVLDIWLRHYPYQPWMWGEALYTASNPTVPDLHTETKDLRLTFGDGHVVTLGRAPWDPVISGARFADGQARAVPFLVAWQRHAQPQDWANIQALASCSIGAVGINRLFHEGNPRYPSNFDALTWARQTLPGALSALHGWQPPVLGIAPNSGQTGSQEDQLWVRGEPLLPNGVGAEWLAYLSALKYANRPCHHREADGDHLDPDGHPELVFWYARPHYHTGVSPDQLGKPATLEHSTVPGGWNGPDRQHWLVGTLTAGYRYTGSPALQALLADQARVFWFGETVDPALSTSGSGSARSIGYAGIVAVRLARNLEDRRFAERIAQRWRDRVNLVYLEQLADKPGNVWDPRQDSRITNDLEGYTHGVMWWQQAVGAYGLDLACEVLGPPEGRTLALNAAKAVLAHAYVLTGDRWVEWDNVGYTDGNPLPRSEMVEGKGAHRTGWFSTAWFPCAPATVLRHEPEHEQARAIWQQMLEDSKNQRQSWLPPGI